VGLGGDLSAAGEAPVGGWPVRVTDNHAHPLDGPGPVIALASGGLATSTTTVRRWTRGGDTVHHLLDPATGLPPPEHWRTASVAAGSCVDANIASCASILLGAGAPSWLNDLGLPARLVNSSGGVTLVGGWPESDPIDNEAVLTP
ncbi:MAG TPA: FAD:protein FMN transferase, partial [Gemmatimonadales bacterium]|nr:FAD:protein FMN transferase [Gemmatimonadales bacterium]